MAFLSDATNPKANPTALEDLDYDELLSETEMSEAAATSYKIHPPPPRITVTVHLGNNTKMIPKTEHHQQLDNSFDYSNSDLHNIINIGRNAKTVIINKGEDHEEVEAYSPTSNYRIPDNYGYNSRKRRRDKQHPLRNQSSRRLTPLTRKFVQTASCTPKESTRISNASSFTKHSEHPHFLPTKTTKKRAKMSKILSDNQWRRS